MCGIVVWWRPPADASRRAFTDAVELQRHRGPDGTHVVHDPEIWLGHNRLAILDLSERADQPMVDPSGRYSLVYNGELYNHLELRDELASGWSFRSSGDTEVVLAALVRWGADAFERFNGMWALALWDREERRLTVSRDRLGVKPLYRTRLGSGVAFASEIKPLLRLRDHAPEPDLAEVGAFLATGAVDARDATWFAGISRVGAGTIETLDDAGQHLRRFWSLPATAPPLDDAGLGALLEDAVQRQLRADVAVGVCLSGGVDSSLVTTLAARHRSLDAFTARHADPSADEGPWAERVRRDRPVRGHDVWFGQDELLDDAARILWHLEEPAKATGVLGQWTVMRAAAGTVRVLLDGQGGDEVFGGYAFHRLPHLRGLAAGREWGRLGREVRATGVTRTIDALRAPALASLARRSPRALATVQRLRGRPAPWPAAFGSRYVDPVVRDQPMARNLRARLRLDLTSEVLPALLRQEDRLSMAFSLESRVPLLDHRVVEAADAMAPSDLICGGWSKAPLRRVLAAAGSPDVAWRRDKQGYPTPANRYFDPADVRRWLTGGRLVDAGILDPTGVDAIVASLDRPHDRLVWHVVQTEWWFRSFIDGDYREPTPWR